MADLGRSPEELMVTLETAISEYAYDGGDWRPLEILLERAFTGPAPERYYPAVFTLFERFPEEDGAGVFWSALHGMEAAGGYEELLLQSFRRRPSLMATTMLRRIKNGGQSHIGQIEIASLLPS